MKTIHCFIAFLLFSFICSAKSSDKELNITITPQVINADYIGNGAEWARIALKQEIFTTKDGVKIFTGDKYVTVSQRTLDLYIGKIGQENSGSSSDILWYFSTKEAAEKFVTAEKGRRLLTEAKLRYPIGTKFKIVSFPGYAEVKYDLKHYPITDQITDGAGGDVYCQGKWGEIISTPYTDCKSSPFTIEQENWIKNQINLNNRRDKCE